MTRRGARACLGEIGLGALWVFKQFCQLLRMNRWYFAILALLIRRTGLFDTSYYLNKYVDVAQSGTEPILHFVVHGDRELRSPMPIFETGGYSGRSGMVERRINSLLHYAWVGRYSSPRLVASGVNRKHFPDSRIWGGIGALLLGILLAKWAWVLLGPRNILAPVAVQPASPAVTGGLFGIPAVSAVPGQSALLTNVRLVGVFAGARGFAVVEFADKHQLGVALGGEVEAGTKLVELAPTYVVFERAGMRQRVMLDGNAVAGEAVTATVSAPTDPLAQQLQAASDAVAAGMQQMGQRMTSARQEK